MHIIIYTIVAYLNIIEPDDVKYVARALNVELPEYLTKTTDLHEYSRVWPYWFLRTDINNSWVNGVLHSLDDNPYINGDSKLWFVNNRLHRSEDKPALIYEDGTQMWFVQGTLHRLNDKPAIISTDGYCV